MKGRILEWVYKVLNPSEARIVNVVVVHLQIRNFSKKFTYIKFILSSFPR